MEQALTAIRELDKDGVFSPYLESSAAEFARAPEALSDDWVREQRQLSGLGGDVDAELLGTARAIRGDKTLGLLYFHCRRLAFELVPFYGDVLKWPSLEPVLPGRTDVFYLLVMMSGVPRLRQLHQLVGAPPAVTAATCGDIASRVSISKEFNAGRIGVSPRCVNWFRLHVTGQLFQFGRLQFHMVMLGEPIRVYRHALTGETLVLAEPGQRFTPAGYYDGTEGRLDADAWRSVWEERGGLVTANALNRGGKAERTPVTVRLEDYRLTLNSSSAVMNTHIPRGAKITIADWRESIRQGFAFFNSRPGFAKPSVCVSKSWLFEPAYQELLPEGGGITALQRRLRLFPIPCHCGRAGFYFMFGDQDIALAQAPRDTSLRRAALDHCAAGGFLRAGGMMVFEDELDTVFAEG